VFAAVAREVADRGAAILCWAVSMNYSFPYEVCCFDDTSFCSLVVGVLTQDVSVLFSGAVLCFAMQLLRFFSWIPPLDGSDGEASLLVLIL